MDISSIARFAAEHDNVISTPELHALGYDDDAIRRIIRLGALHRVARGVHVVGSRLLTFRGRCRVALHLAGPGSAIAGYAAMYLDGVIPWEPRIVDVLSRGRRSVRRVPGIRMRSSRLFEDADVQVRDGIRTLKFARALVTVAADRTADQLAKLIREARFRERLDLDQLRMTIERCKRLGHVDRLREAVAHVDRGSNGSYSRGETSMWTALHDVVADEIPLQNPEMYLDGEPTLPDLVWERSLVIAEYDGAPHLFTDVRICDRERERRYRREHFVVIRVTPEDLDEHRDEIRTDVHAAIESQRRAIAAGLICPRPIREYARSAADASRSAQPVRATGTQRE